MNDHDYRNAIAPSEMPFGRNVRSDGSSKEQRKGYVDPFNFTLTSTSGAPKVKHLTGYSPTDQANDQLLAFSNNTFSSISLTAFTNSDITAPTITSYDTINTAGWRDYVFIFNGIDKINVYNSQVSAYLTGGSSATSVVATWTAVANGEFAITIDGVARDVTGINFAGALTMVDVAAKIQAALRLVTGSFETVVWSTNHFVVSSVNHTSASAITVTRAVSGGSGTDISGVGATAFMDAETGRGTVTTRASQIMSQPAVLPDSIVAASDFTPLFGDVTFNRLCVAGVRNSNVVYISKPASSATPSAIYDFSGSVTSFGAAGEVLLKKRPTAIKDFNGSAIFFDTQGAYTFSGFIDLGGAQTPDVTPIEGAAGCVGQKLAVVVENDLYYLTPSNELRTIRRDSTQSLYYRVVPLSDKIRNFMLSLDPDQSDGVAYYDQEERTVNFLVKSYGSAYNDYRICIDLKLLNAKVSNFFIDDQMQFSAATYFQGVYLGGHFTPKVYRDNQGVNDNEASIVSQWYTKQFDGGEPTVNKRYRRIRIFGRATSDTVITAKVYVAGSLVATQEINGNDVSSPAAQGIATSAVASFTIGAEGTDSSSFFESDLNEFVEIISFRATGKEIMVKFESEALLSKYKIDSIEFEYVPLSRTYIANTERQ